MRQEKIADFISCIERKGFKANKRVGIECDYQSDFHGYIRLCLASGHWMHVLPNFVGLKTEIEYGTTLAQLQKHLAYIK